MLVSVALVLLLMTLFAQVFQIAGGSVSTQRGIMENDQRARTAQILITGDLNKRTFRKVIPFAFNEDTAAPEAELAKRRGYLYISENSTTNDGDDVLALTVDARITTDSPDELPYYGRALPIWPDPIPVGTTPPEVPSSVAVQYRDDYFFRANPNQPEGDDSRLDYNLSALSPAAEVVYFLRNGNLYRRVLLMRQPANGDSASEQPTNLNDEDFFAREYPPASGVNYPGAFSTGYDSTGASQGNPVNFWRHYDFSAHPTIVADTSMPPTYYYNGLAFNGVSTLLMSYSVPTFVYSSSPSSFQPPTEIAYPPNRFGFNTVNPSPLSAGTPAPPHGGQPREYGTGGWWVGRLTMEETSHADMDYPMLTHIVPTGTNDTNNEFNTASTWDDTASGSDYVIDDYTGGPWRGEDLLLTNVHAFDVKVWDEVLNQFVDIGHTLPAVNGALGDFHILRRNNNRFGPVKASDPTDGTANPRDPTGLVQTGRRVFDTWYPFRTEDINGDGTLAPSEDDDTDGILDSGEDDDTDGVLDGISEDGIAGDTEIAGQLLDFDADGNVTMNDSDSDGVVDYGEPVPPYRPTTATPIKPNPMGGYVRYERWVANTSTSGTRYAIGNRVFPSVRPYQTQFGDPFYYICVGINEDGANAGGSHSMTEPIWPRTAGLKVNDGELVWQAVDNRKPLRAIQITLRFIDPTTSQMRTLTLQHSLVD